MVNTGWKEKGIAELTSKHTALLVIVPQRRHYLIDEGCEGVERAKAKTKCKEEQPEVGIFRKSLQRLQSLLFASLAGS